MTSLLTGDDFRRLALELDGVTEQAHMNHPDFRAHGRIFASLLANEERAGLKLSVDEQRELMRRHPAAFTPAAGAWGRQGWTVLNLAAADTATARSALLLAYEQVKAAATSRRGRQSRAAGSRHVSRKR